MFAAMGGWAGLGARSLASPLALSSTLAHVVAPWGMLLAWLFAARHGALRWRDALRFMLFPLAYLAQMAVRGAAGDGYPYPDVDVDRVGWLAALGFVGAVTLLFLAMGLVIVWLDRRLATRGSISV